MIILIIIEVIGKVKYAAKTLKKQYNTVDFQQIQDGAIQLLTLLES